MSVTDFLGTAARLGEEAGLDRGGWHGMHGLKLAESIAALTSQHSGLSSCCESLVDACRGSPGLQGGGVLIF